MPTPINPSSGSDDPRNIQPAQANDKQDGLHSLASRVNHSRSTIDTASAQKLQTKKREYKHTSPDSQNPTEKKTDNERHKICSKKRH